MPEQTSNTDPDFETNVCPGTLAEGFSTYSPVCLRNLFGGRKVSHILPFASPQQSEETIELFIENRKRISISGVQEKLSLILEKNILRLTAPGESGTHILKPIPHDIRNAGQAPANEHLTMQIARKVYGINTAENALIFFRDGVPAYLTGRFDIGSDGRRKGVEDFAALAGKTHANAGPNFKYKYSYEEIGELIRKYIPAWRIEIEKYFSLVVFNFLFSNGDAHLKNFSVTETQHGDYILSPAYDLINTRLHVDDDYFALAGGLFADDFKSEKYTSSRHPAKGDFIEFGRRIGVLENRIETLLRLFAERQTKVETLLKHSFLDEKTKKGYLMSYRHRRNLLNT
jgi:serine/threonine-protein kinase HipA